MRDSVTPDELFEVINAGPEDPKDFEEWLAPSLPNLPFPPEILDNYLKARKAGESEEVLRQQFKDDIEQYFEDIKAQMASSGEPRPMPPEVMEDLARIAKLRNEAAELLESSLVEIGEGDGEVLLSEPLAHFVRSLEGLDRTAVHATFTEFLDIGSLWRSDSFKNRSLTPPQIRFVEMVIDQLTARPLPRPWFRWGSRR